jgi:hypothetical protein
MKRKVIFCLVLAMCICSLGSVNAESVAGYLPSDFSAVIQAGAPAVAMAAVGIPAYDLKNLKCVTQEAFAGLQAKFGKLYVIDVMIDNDEIYQFLMRRPTRQHLEIIGSYRGDATRIDDFIIKNLVIAGNESNALDDGIVFSQFNATARKIVDAGNVFFGKA